MHNVFDIRGTHGSGKSTLPREILRNHKADIISGLPLTYEGRVGPLGYFVPELNLYILGKYSNACGGCDGIKTQDEIKARVHHWLQKGNVMLEGILVAHTYQPWVEFAKRTEADYDAQWNFLVLDTDVETCVARVNERRQAAGKGPIENEGNIRRDHQRISTFLPRFLNEGLSAMHWSGQRQYAQFMEVFYGN